MTRMNNEALTIEAKKHITEIAQSKQPFFLHLSHYAVHSQTGSTHALLPLFGFRQAQSTRRCVVGMDRRSMTCSMFEKLGAAEDTLVILHGDNGSDAPLERNAIANWHHCAARRGALRRRHARIRAA